MSCILMGSDSVRKPILYLLEHKHKLTFLAYTAIRLIGVFSIFNMNRIGLIVAHRVLIYKRTSLVLLRYHANLVL